MRVNVLVHLEEVPEEPGYAWWAESADAPGFSAAADSLPELLRRVNAALPEVLAEAGVDPADLRIVPELVFDTDASVAAPPRNQQPEDVPNQHGFDVRQRLVAISR